jgi:predicted nucleotidyltransferase
MDGFVSQHRGEILKIAAQHGARTIRLFGSTARGDPRAGSDIDLLVDLEPGRSLLDLIAIKQDLEDVLGRPVDVVTEAAISPYIRQRVLADAIPL